MKFILIILLIFSILSCEKEKPRKSSAPAPAHITTIKPEGKSVLIDSALVNSYGSKTLKEFYFSSGFKSVWQSKEDRKIILEQLLNSAEDGLNPADYSIEKLQKFEKIYANLSDKDRGIYDILFTHSFQKYILHQTNGRLNPRNLYKDWDLKENKIDINGTIAKLIKSDSLVFRIEQLKPNHLVYKSLKKALKIINTFPNDNFKAIEIANKIIQNDTNTALIDIKKRLIYWKLLHPKDSLSSIYDNETAEAVKKFQMLHGLAADGVIGKGTIASLNFTKNQRKKQIIANLERWKWYPKEMGKEYLIINIPDYRLTLVKDNDTIRTHKVIVGSAKRRTPVLSSNITHVIFNPTWTVPPTILKEDVIPAISRNRNYLAQSNIKVYDSNGKVVSANNWLLSRAKSYRYVQSPGTFNSLGMVKLVFPNRFSIYLHDTNHRDFFGKQMRSLSSGCVRVEHPLKLAEYLLDDERNWNLEKITQTLQNEKTKQIKIKNDVTIHVLYWTAWSEDNRLIFRDDIYNLDANLYQKLRK
ncbi:MAG: L,D-transpeptidase family protein [Flavobacterium sp.]|nr:L,D-transpeptidase family protein [Flavobacterium sp.]